MPPSEVRTIGLGAFGEPQIVGEGDALPKSRLRLSTCPKLTSADRAILMWANRVVPMGQDRPSRQTDARFLLGGDLVHDRVPAPIQTSTTMEPGVRSRCPNVFQDHLATHQRVPGPVRADQTEHPV